MLGAGLVVPGTSVLPPMLEPEGAPEEDPLPVGLPLPGSEGIVLVAPPELPPVVPAHALSSTAQAMGIIHLVVNYSRKDKKAVPTTTTYRKTA